MKACERSAEVIKKIKSENTFDFKIERIDAINVYGDYFRVNIYSAVESSGDLAVRSLKIAESRFMKL